MQEIGRGAKVFDAAPVRGRFLPMEGPDDVLALMDTGAEGVVALVRDAGATFLAPIYHELTGDHLHERHRAQPHRDREPRVPGAVRDGLRLLAATSPPPGAEVELDCSGDEAVVRG